jgi:four helix bundle protein
LELNQGDEQTGAGIISEFGFGIWDCSEAMNKQELEQRTKQFSLEVIRFLESLPKNYLGEALGRQLIKSGTSIGANYREANRAESKADFIHKLAIAEKEASETLYWLELMLEAGIGGKQEALRLMQEAKELLAIFTAAGRTSKGRS